MYAAGMGDGDWQARALLCGVAVGIAACGSGGHAAGPADAAGGTGSGGADAASAPDARDTGASADGAAAGAADFFDRYETGYCNYLVACAVEPDLATCRAAWQTFLPWFPPQVLKDVASGAVVYDPEMARACIAAFADPACTQTWYAGWVDQRSRACSGVFTGTLPNDSDCFLSVECAGHASCVPTDADCSAATGCCAGTCVAQPDTTIPLNARCPEANDVLSLCVQGSYCAAGPGGTATCQPLLTTVGAACASQRQCAPPLYCKHDPMTVYGVCAQPSPPGAACHPSSDEQSLSCESMLTLCNTDTATCDALVPVGGSCGVSSFCTTDATCSAATPRTCTPLPGRGQPCTPDSTPCLFTLTCDPTSKTCVPRLAGECG
jgi:hypothetical protein